MPAATAYAARYQFIYMHVFLLTIREDAKRLPGKKTLEAEKSEKSKILKQNAVLCEY
jgi:hypothetical protein